MQIFVFLFVHGCRAIRLHMINNNHNDSGERTTAVQWQQQHHHHHHRHYTRYALKTLIFFFLRDMRLRIRSHTMEVVVSVTFSREKYLFSYFILPIFFLFFFYYNRNRFFFPAEMNILFLNVETQIQSEKKMLCDVQWQMTIIRKMTYVIWLHCVCWLNRC